MSPSMVGILHSTRENGSGTEAGRKREDKNKLSRHVEDRPITERFELSLPRELD